MKQVKKEKFIRIFLLRFLVLLVVFLAVCFGVTSILHFQYTTSKDMEMEKWVEEEKLGIYEKYTGLKSEGKEGKELMDTFTRNLQWSADICTPPNFGPVVYEETEAMAVYNVDTKELYAKSDKNVYMILKEYKGYGGYFRYEGNHFEEFEDIYQRLSAFEEKEMSKPIPHIDEYYEIVMDGIYVTKENTFTPKNIRLVKFSSQTKEELETLVSYNMEPDDPSGYTYFAMEELPDIKLSQPVMAGFGTSDKQNAREVLDAFLEGKTRWQRDLDSILKSEAVWGSSGDGLRIMASRLYMDDTTLQVIAVCTYDFWGARKEGLLRFYLIFFILCMITASLWSLYRYKMNKGYYELDQYRKQTTNILAHDLKTPLTAIMGYTENLQQDTHPEKKTYYLDSILSNVGYMNEIIEKVLALGKVEDAGYKISREEVSLPEYIHEVTQKYELLMNEKGLQIEVDGTAVIYSDILLVRQLLDNLIGNAVKYSLKGTVIDIEITEGKISITNQMEEALEVEPDTLLQPFVKGDDSRGGSTGSGLGLTIVNHIVKLLNYKMKISMDGNAFVVEIEW